MMNKLTSLMTFIKAATYFILIAYLAASLGCSELKDNSSGQTSGKRQREKYDIKYHTEYNTGRWEEKAPTHLPVYLLEKKGGSINIKVSVPLKGSNFPIHYIEVIILADSNHREIRKTSFNRGERNAAAEFTVPDDTRFPLYAVIKCNLHDMWESKIELEKIR